MTDTTDEKCYFCNRPAGHQRLPASFAPHAKKLGLLPCDYDASDAPDCNEPMTLGERLQAAIAGAA